ncbi:hypothetical protein JCM10207_000067 [Rhodosporidiobolus poonsookiae]
MTDSITLTSSDTPPVSLTVPRAVLTVNSKVFAGLLSLPSSSNKDSEQDALTLAETEKDLRPFLCLLEGKDLEGEMDHKGWESLARLSDKYDSFTVRLACVARAWQTIEDILGEKSWENFGGSEEWKVKIDNWKTSCKLYAFDLLHHAAQGYRDLLRLRAVAGFCNGFCSASVVSNLSAEITTALGSLDPAWGFRHLPEFEQDRGCDACKIFLRNLGQTLADGWSRAPALSLEWVLALPISSPR